MTGLLHGLTRSLLLAGAMFWTVFWALVLGFVRAAIVRVLLDREQAERTFGGQGLREVALAAAWGAGSFAPSYAAVAMARTLFRKGGSVICALVFLFASTNLSTEFLLVLWLLMGWRVVLLELVGGVAFIAVLWLIVRVGWRGAWAEQAQDHRATDTGDGAGRHTDSPRPVEGNTLRQKAISRRNWLSVAEVFVGQWRRAWLEMLLGFVLSGGLAVFVSHRWWQTLVERHTSEGVRMVEHALVGPLVAAVSCIPSPGNLPLASVLRSEGLDISGVLAFLYADVLALPLLLMYRRHVGPRAAAFVALALCASSFAAGVAARVFSLAVHLVPRVMPPPPLVSSVSGQWRVPTLPNLAALLVAGALVAVRIRYGGRRGESGAGG